jgi:hypothetical protein
LKGLVHEVDADDHEEILERVAAIDVAKASAKVCTRAYRTPRSKDDV